MDQGTADAISVIEKQMAEKDARIAALENKLAAFQKAFDAWNTRCDDMVSSFHAALKILDGGLGQ